LPRIVFVEIPLQQRRESPNTPEGIANLVGHRRSHLAERRRAIFPANPLAKPFDLTAILAHLDRANHAPAFAGERRIPLQNRAGASITGTQSPRTSSIG